MADHDDLDLVALFGLSAEEAGSLGLGATRAGQDSASAEPVADVTGVPGAPAHATTAVPVAGGVSAKMEQSATSWAGSSATSGGSLADESALFAMLDGHAPGDSTGYSGYGVLHVEPAPSVEDDGESESSVEDDIDIAALFGLSMEEEVGLGLAEPLPAEDRQEDTAEAALAPPTPVLTTGRSVADSASPGYLPANADTPRAGAPPPGLRLVPDAVPVEAYDREEADQAAGAGDMIDSFMEDDPVTTTDALAIDPALFEAFAEESAELLDGLHVELERLEVNQADYEALLETRRVVHTIKGGAKMCGFEQVVTLAHSCENLLDLIAARTALLDTPALRALFACEPLLRAAVHDAISGGNGQIGGLTELAAHFDALCAAMGRTGDGAASLRESQALDSFLDPRVVAPLERAVEGVDGAEASVAPENEDGAAPATMAGGMEGQGDDGATSGQEGNEDRARALEPRATGRRNATSISVDLTKVEAVVAKVTEMAAHRASYQGMVGQLMETAEEARRNVTRLQRLVTRVGNECAITQAQDDDAIADHHGLESYNPLNTLVLQLQEVVSDQQALVQKMYDTITTHWRLRAAESRVDADLQSALMNIRLIPLAAMRVRLDGVVRQAAQATGKNVRWQLQGGNVAVEKNVFDRLFEPLMHLLRNAIDHGLETSAARRAAGKPETGAIMVTARQENNQVVISVSDDGAGIVPNRIAALAVDRGIISGEQAGLLSAQQKIALIFTPGFSTAGEVSHLSGRGVGMDAVREVCLRMGGTIDVNSQQGIGTTTTMRLPLSLSVTRGLVVRDGGCLMALPVAQISALHLVPAADIVQTPLGRVARIEGQELPVYNLPPLPGATPVSYVQNGEVNVLQAPHEGGSIGIVIEDVLHEEEMLIKAPPALLRHVTALLGAYVLPDGNVAPVINLPQMLATLRPVATLNAPVEARAAGELVALVVDDSMSMRVALSGTLQGAGFTVLTARDGQEALDILKREGLPRLITLDIEMPRMDGLETLFAIRQMPGAQDLPVFMMTSRGGTKHRRAAENLGATRYFTKPYRDSELAAAARDICGGLSA